MRSLILCEGFDDVLIIGYFLHKKGGWNFTSQGQFSELYDLPKLDAKREATELYIRGNDVLGIWAVGGKNSFGEAYKFINSVNSRYPEQCINKLFVLMDRDEDEIDACLSQTKSQLVEYGIYADQLKNGEKAEYKFIIEDDTYTMEIIPVIIPFDIEGALETVLMNGIAESGEEEKYIVENAIKYIDDVIDSGNVTRYLKHARDVLKAKLSATISITNPNRSTGTFDKVLLSWNWEETDAAKRHFETILYYLNN